MKTDPILRAIRAIRDAHAKAFGYDLARMVEDHQRYANELKKQGWQFVRPPRRSKNRKTAA